MSPVDGVTLDEAAHIVGCSRRTLIRHIEAGRLPAGPANQPRRVSRARCRDVGAWVAVVACRVRRGVVVLGRRHDSRGTGWGRVARLNQLVAAERIPFEVHTDGRRIYRREQLLTVANARDARWHGRPRTVFGR